MHSQDQNTKQNGNQDDADRDQSVGRKRDLQKDSGNDKAGVADHLIELITEVEREKQKQYFNQDKGGKEGVEKGLIDRFQRVNNTIQRQRQMAQVHQAPDKEDHKKQKQD